jgi:hypothetical protein
MGGAAVTAYLGLPVPSRLSGPSVHDALDKVIIETRKNELYFDQYAWAEALLTLMVACYDEGQNA